MTSEMKGWVDGMNGVENTTEDEVRWRYGEEKLGM
jgi:hypothetical protein